MTSNLHFNTTSINTTFSTDIRTIKLLESAETLNSYLYYKKKKVSLCISMYCQNYCKGENLMYGGRMKIGKEDKQYHLHKSHDNRNKCLVIVFWSWISILLNHAILYGLPWFVKFIENNKYPRNHKWLLKERWLIVVIHISTSIFSIWLWETVSPLNLKKICYIKFAENKDESYCARQHKKMKSRSSNSKKVVTWKWPFKIWQIHFSINKQYWWHVVLLS